MSLDVETQDLRRPSLCLIGTLRDLDTACFAPTTGLDLCLDDHHGGTDCGGGLLGLGRGSSRYAAEHRNPVGLEDVSRLVLVQIHTCLRAPLTWDKPDSWRKTPLGAPPDRRSEAYLWPSSWMQQRRSWSLGRQLAASARLTNYEFCGEALVAGQGRTEIEDHGNSSFGHRPDRLPSDGEGWPAILRLRRAVVGHDRNVIWAAQTCFADGFEGADAQLI